MAQQGPVGRDQTVVGCGRFEKPNLNAIAIGDMMFHLIKPIIKEKSLQNYPYSRLEPVATNLRRSTSCV